MIKKFHGLSGVQRNERWSTRRLHIHQQLELSTAEETSIDSTCTRIHSFRGYSDFIYSLAWIGSVCTRSETALTARRGDGASGLTYNADLVWLKALHAISSVHSRYTLERLRYFCIGSCIHAQTCRHEKSAETVERYSYFPVIVV